jgi:hypothetical protein
MMIRSSEFVVDLHVHIFNECSLPLAGMFANAMGKEAADSPLARAPASMANRLTKSRFLSAAVDKMRGWAAAAVVRKAFKRLNGFVKAGDDIRNYPAFVRRELHSEYRLVDKLVAGSRAELRRNANPAQLRTLRKFPSCRRCPVGDWKYSDGWVATGETWSSPFDRVRTSMSSKACSTIPQNLQHGLITSLE